MYLRCAQIRGLLESSLALTRRLDSRLEGALTRLNSSFSSSSRRVEWLPPSSRVPSLSSSSSKPLESSSSSDLSSQVNLTAVKSGHCCVVNFSRNRWSGAEKEVGLFPTRPQELIEAFYAKGQDFPSYEELLRILCGGSLIQECSFCSNTTKVEALYGEKRGLGCALVNPHSSPTFMCGKPACDKEMVKKMGAWADWLLAEKALFNKLQITRCDFCFKLAEKVKR